MARHRAMAALLTLALAGGSGCGGDDEPREPGRFFAPDGVWNQPLKKDAPVSDRSRELVAELRRQVDGAGAYINTTEYSTPVYRVGRRQRRVKVTLDTVYPPLQRALRSVPIPAGARPAGGSDRHMVVWQPSTDTMWELWLARRRADGWHARWGARITKASRNPGWIRAPLGATATGLPLAGGLMRASEVRSRRIRHALAFALPEAKAGAFTLPARRTDGQVLSATAVPLGTRFRLDPDLDLGKLGLPKPTLAIARAAQRYGMIARDKAGAVVLYGEAPKPGARNPWPGAFGGSTPDELLRRFPWDRLEVVRAPVRTAPGTGRR